MAWFVCVCVCHSQQLDDFNILSWRIAIGLGEHTLQIPLKLMVTVIAVPDGPTNGFGGARPCLDHDTVPVRLKIGDTGYPIEWPF